MYLMVTLVNGVVCGAIKMRFDKEHCQNCKKWFDVEKCDMAQVESEAYVGDMINVFICPHCKHGNYSDNVSIKLHKVERQSTLTEEYL